MNEGEYSEAVSAKIDAEVSRIMNESFAKARKAIKEHKKTLDAIAKNLIETETIEQAEFEKILIVNGITPKKKEEMNLKRAKMAALFDFCR